VPSSPRPFPKAVPKSGTQLFSLPRKLQSQRKHRRRECAVGWGLDQKRVALGFLAIEGAQPQNAKRTYGQTINFFIFLGFKMCRLIVVLGDGLLVAAVGNAITDALKGTHSESNSSILPSSVTW
jgi:hypothetical protein